MTLSEERGSFIFIEIVKILHHIPKLMPVLVIIQLR